MFQLQADSSIDALAFSTTGLLAVFTRNRSIVVWDLATQAARVTLPDQSEDTYVNQFWFRNDPAILTFTSFGMDIDHFSLDNSGYYGTYFGPRNIWISPDCQHFYQLTPRQFICREIQLGICQHETGPNLSADYPRAWKMRTSQLGFPDAPNIKPDEESLVFAANTREIAFWRTPGRHLAFLHQDTGRPTRPPLTFPTRPGVDYHYLYLMSPDGRWLLKQANELLRIHDTTDTKPVWQRRSTRYWRGLNSRFTTDSQQFLTPTGTGVVRCWDTTTWAELTPLKWSKGPLTALAVSPDGLLAAVGDEAGTITVWDLDE